MQTPVNMGSAAERNEPSGRGQRSLGTFGALWFYAGIPVIISLFIAINEPGSARFEYKSLYFVRQWIPLQGVWLVLGVCSHLVSRMLARWRPGLLAISAIAALIGLLANGPISLIPDYLLRPYLLPDSEFFPLLPYRFEDPLYLGKAVLAYLQIMISWFGANYFLLKFLGIPRFGIGAVAPEQRAAPSSFNADDESAPDPTQQAIAASILCEKLPAHIGTDILALRSEEHYLRVYTSQGDALVLFRLADAIRDLAHLDGMQVHRSYWVRRSAIDRVEKSGRTYQLTLSNAQQVPVSRTFKLKFEEWYGL